MRNRLGMWLVGLVAFGFTTNLAWGQAPSSIAGDGILQIVSSGVYPLASYGYALFLPANSGNSYTTVGIYGVANGSGTYSYSVTGGSTATLNLADSSGLNGFVQTTFTSADEGSYYEYLTADSNINESGSFGFSYINAPASITGKTYFCAIANGRSPFYSSGSYTLTIASSGNTYTSSSGSQGTYSYSTPNRSTGLMQLNDLLVGSAAAYFAFSSPTGGAFAIKSASGFQVGTFIVLDTTPPTCSILMPTAGQKWSNSVFTVTGKAGDNTQVDQVFYHVLGENWISASTTNGWTNWFGDIALTTPGTNVIEAYSVDSSGNFSPTVSQTVFYVLTAMATVNTNGSGTISPNYNGAFLAVGNNYTMTAAAGPGFTFISWTDGDSNVITNKPSVQFVMQSGLALTAYFADTTKPFLSFASPTPGERWSNGVFTATGSATDNWQVASVQYQLNGGTWIAAEGAKNWSAALTLIPGTNILAAFAVDTSGNMSSTNQVRIDFVVTNQMQLHISGLGAVTPNDSNAWLEIGRNYSITSAPASGFVFTNWVVSSNWAGGTTATGTSLQFMMSSNLTVQATFVETSRPSLTVISPASGQHLTNALATIIGTANDKWGLTGIWYQLNTGSWAAAQSTNNWTNWTTQAQMVAGTNTFKLYAMNLGGNVSTTNAFTVISSNTFRLLLEFTNSVPLQPDGLALRLELSTGLNGHLQASTNLIDWKTFTNFTGTNSTLLFTDPEANSLRSRFYRAVIP